MPPFATQFKARFGQGVIAAQPTAADLGAAGSAGGATGVDGGSILGSAEGAVSMASTADGVGSAAGAASVFIVSADPSAGAGLSPLSSGTRLAHVVPRAAPGLAASA